MPSVSKKQQGAAAVALAAKQGKKVRTGAAARSMMNMSKEQLKEFLKRK